MKKRLSVILVIVGWLLIISGHSILFGITTPINAQVIINDTNSQQANSTLSEIEKIDSNAELLKVKQLNERDLRNKITELELEKSNLEKTILDLQKTEAALENSITKLKSLQENLPQDTSPDSIQILEEDISKNEKSLIETSSELAKKQSTLEATNKTLSLAQEQLGKQTNDVKQETNDLQTQIVSIFSQYSLYLFLIISYFFALQFIHALADKFVVNEMARDIIKGIVAVIIVCATIGTVLFAFVGNLTYLLTGLGVISAALVVALQDFVSSFFAFLWIRFRSIYKTKDVIMIDSGANNKFIGVVTQIGLFRTSLRELFYGTNEVSTEKLSGRVISIPNNVIMKTPVVNFTHDNRLLWHTLELTITFESDFNLAQSLLNRIIEEQFKYALDHKDQLLDETYNLKYLYQPKVYLSIASNGPHFTIHFAVRYGHYQEVLESISKNILNSFNTHGIDLAYNTSRIVRQDLRQGAVFGNGIMG